MQMESQYLVSTKSAEATDSLFDLWEDALDKMDDYSFEGFATDVFEIMASVIKVVYVMEKEDYKEDFTVVGKCETDCDCIVFSIEYNGAEPMIKVDQADPEIDEDKYEDFCNADYEDIPELLEQSKGVTFKQAIEEDLPLGGFLDEPYDSWYQSIIDEL